MNSVREYWNRRPCNSRHSSKPLGTVDYFFEVAKRRYTVEPHIREFADFSGACDKMVLDAGCGIGTDAIYFALAGARVTALDSSHMSIHIAEQSAKALHITDRMSFVCCDIEDVAGGSYDLIYSFGAVHHTPRPGVTMNHLRAACSPGATLKLMVYHKYSWKALQLWLKHGSKARYFTEAQEGCPITYWYSKKEAKQLVEGAGFKVTDMQVRFVFPYRIKDYIEHKYVKGFGALLQPFEQWIGWHILITGKAV